MNKESLVFALKQAGALDDERVAAAFAAVPRHLFLPDVPTETVYTNRAVYTRTDDRGGYIGGSDAPSHIATLLTLADLQHGHNVLEIGTGTGYSAALMQHMVGDSGLVTSIESDKGTADAALDHLQRAHMSRVKVVNADGAGGYSPRASYDRIVSSVALWDVPPTWVKQLRPNGRIIAPLYLDGLQVIVALQVAADGSLVSQQQAACSFVPMLGTEAPPPQVVYLGGGSSLRLYSTRAHEIDTARLHTLMLSDDEHCHLGATPDASTYWNGFVPYLMLRETKDYDFLCYTVEGDKIVYGLQGQGFGLVTMGSATFVSTKELGDTHCFAGVDAFLVIDEEFQRWNQLGRPTIAQMTVQFIPPEATPPSIPALGRIYPRHHNTLYVWMTPSA